MRLEGIHHITAITADAPANVEFYAGVLGLRLVKKSVNQDDPTVYHLFYADERGSAGSDLTFFEYPGAPIGWPGAGMIHRIVWRVGSEDALAFWEERLDSHGIRTRRGPDNLLFADPEGLGLELRLVVTDDPPLRAEHPHVPPEFALLGFDGARAYAADPAPSASLLEDTLGFLPRPDGIWSVRGEERGSFWAYDEAPAGRGLAGAGTVHHIAWASPMDEHADWRDRVVAAGMQATPVIDRFYFRSVYFREPSGVLFEIATLGPGFTADEPLATLGQRLALPPAYEPLRERLEEVLTPLPDPRGRALAEQRR